MASLISRWETQLTQLMSSSIWWFYLMTSSERQRQFLLSLLAFLYTRHHLFRTNHARSLVLKMSSFGSTIEPSSRRKTKASATFGGTHKRSGRFTGNKRLRFPSSTPLSRKLTTLTWSSRSSMPWDLALSKKHTAGAIKTKYWYR